MSETVNVRGASDSLYEGMTKEDIITAIEQATGGDIGDLDTGFITIWKEQNAGIGIKLWVGTTAQYEALDPKPTNTIYIKTDDSTIEDINAAIAAIQAAITAIETGDSFAPENHAYSTSKYGAATSSDYGHVKLITNLTTLVSYPDGTAIRGDVAYSIGQRLGAVENAVYDSGWTNITVNTSGGWTAGTGGRVPQYRKIGDVVYFKGDVIGSSGSSPSAEVGTAGAPTATRYGLASTNTSDKKAPITYTQTTGTIVINDQMADYTGLTVHLDNISFCY